MSGKPPKLSKDQADVLRQRYDIYLANHPKVLMREYGICQSTLRRYVVHGQKHHA